MTESKTDLWQSASFKWDITYIMGFAISGKKKFCGVILPMKDKYQLVYKVNIITI